MKPLIQKLPRSENYSFVAQTFRTPQFEVGWHQHVEYELILFTEGSGLSFIGNHVGEFDTGDIYLLGPNLPHTFQKRSPEVVSSAVVVHFNDTFWGSDFLLLPECRMLRRLLNNAMSGLKIYSNLQQLSSLIKSLEGATGFQRILLLGQCLDIMSNSAAYTPVSTQEVKQADNNDKVIDRVFQYTIENFREPITLSTIADLACMSVPAFCNYFKKSTKKTYIDFLNETRVNYACNLLVDTKSSVFEICFDSGYNTMANFHKQFMRLKKSTPLQYRKYYSKLTQPQNNIHILED